MATTQGAPPSNVSPNSMYAVKAMKADAIRNRSARRILHFRGGVSDRGRPKLDFSKFHIIRFALIRQHGKCDKDHEEDGGVHIAYPNSGHRNITTHSHTYPCRGASLRQPPAHHPTWPAAPMRPP